MSINWIQFKKHVLCYVLTLNYSAIVAIIIIIIAEPICVVCCCSFQRKVEMFHEVFVSASGENEDGYVAKTIALANCCPPFRYIYTHFFFNSRQFFFNMQIYLLENVYMCTANRSFVERCVHSDPAVSEDSGRRANTALDKIVNLSVRVLNDRIFEHIRVSMSYTHPYTHARFKEPCSLDRHTYKICWFTGTLITEMQVQESYMIDR